MSVQGRSRAGGAPAWGCRRDGGGHCCGRSGRGGRRKYVAWLLFYYGYVVFVMFNVCLCPSLKPTCVFWYFVFLAGSRKHALPTDSTTTTSEPSTKRPRIDYSNPHTVPAATSTSTTTASTGQSACANTRGSGKSAAKPVAPSLTDFPLAKCEMNLWDVKYRKDTRPLVRFCIICLIRLII